MNNIFKAMIKEKLVPELLLQESIYQNTDGEQEREKIRLGALMIEKITFMIADSNNWLQARKMVRDTIKCNYT